MGDGVVLEDSLVPKKPPDVNWREKAHALVKGKSFLELMILQEDPLFFLWLALDALKEAEEKLAEKGPEPVTLKLHIADRCPLATREGLCRHPNAVQRECVSTSGCRLHSQPVLLTVAKRKGGA